MSSRRSFLAACLAGLSRKNPRAIGGSFFDTSHGIGHQLRDGAVKLAPKQVLRIPVVIVGGGIAGLSAAWRFHKRGFRDFVLLEMESQAGGNARWGENEVSRFPWAAHYVPVPGPGTPLVRELFEELGLLRAGQWEERHLCHSPQERLYINGRWQEGLEPELAATTADREDFRRFAVLLESFRASGEFAIPAETGRRRMSHLDHVSMGHYLREQRIGSPYLRWYIDYCCRDDYGSALDHTSAWAGIHYFASRPAEEIGPLTWPEGNGWIVERLLERLRPFVRTGAMVFRVLRDKTGFRVLTAAIEYRTEVVVFAAPVFLAAHVVEGFSSPGGFEYSPWLTANLTLDRWPRERGLPPAWDNVIFNTPSLGYVVATHQSLRTRNDQTVWTWYRPLAELAAQDGRRLLLQKPWAYWRDEILADLSRAHPDIRDCVRRIDVMRIGHAMIRPSVGIQFSPSRQRLCTLAGNLLFASSDLSGLSLFEEAQYRGVRAADAALRRISRAGA